jgi:cobalamin biosynthesis Mg chelatase CobN
MNTRRSIEWLLGSALILTTACSSGLSAHATLHSPSGFDLRKPLTVSTPSPFVEAYGERHGNRAYRSHAQTDLDAFLKPVVAAKLAPPVVMATQPARSSIAQTAPIPSQALVTLAPVSQPTKPAVVSAPKTQADSERYATRETTSEKQQQFRGGDVVVVGASTLLLVVLVLILLILIAR